jgi:hypothetical protein
MALEMLRLLEATVTDVALSDDHDDVRDEDNNMVSLRNLDACRSARSRWSFGDCKSRGVDECQDSIVVNGKVE